MGRNNLGPNQAFFLRCNINSISIIWKITQLKSIFWMQVIAHSGIALLLCGLFCRGADKELAGLATCVLYKHSHWRKAPGVIASVLTNFVLMVDNPWRLEGFFFFLLFFFCCFLFLNYAFMHLLCICLRHILNIRHPKWIIHKIHF